MDSHGHCIVHDIIFRRDGAEHLLHERFLLIFADCAETEVRGWIFLRSAGTSPRLRPAARARARAGGARGARVNKTP